MTRADFARALRPDRSPAPAAALALAGAWATALVLAWLASPYESLPKPAEVARALAALWWGQGLGPEIFTSLALIATATVVTVVASLALSYLGAVPAFRPAVGAAAKLRFLGLTGLVFPFTLAFGGGRALKVALLAFGMSSFFVTSMAQIVAEIPRSEYDHLRALGASEARIVWEVVVLGTLDRALDVLRQNVAVGWALLTTVEGIARAEGGLGALLLNQNKHFHLAEVYAILTVVLALGLLIDWSLGALCRALCPYAHLGRARS